MLTQTITRSGTSLWLAALLLGVAACSSSDDRRNEDGESTASGTMSGRGYTDATRVVTSDGTVLSGPPLMITLVNASSGVTVTVEVAASADGVDDWQARGGATEADVEAGRFVLDVRTQAAAPGVANVMRTNETDQIVQATTGQLTIELHDEQLATGSAVTELDELSAEFDGDFVLECWVKPEELGQEANGSGDGMHVHDVDMASEFCQQFTRWR